MPIIQIQGVRMNENDSKKNQFADWKKSIGLIDGKSLTSNDYLRMKSGLATVKAHLKLQELKKKKDKQK